jgi:hypothetical protein
MHERAVSRSPSPSATRPSTARADARSESLPISAAMPRNSPCARRARAASPTATSANAATPPQRRAWPSGSAGTHLLFAASPLWRAARCNGVRFSWHHTGVLASSNGQDNGHRASVDHDQPSRQSDGRLPIHRESNAKGRAIARGINWCACTPGWPTCSRQGPRRSKTASPGRLPAPFAARR